MREAWAVRPLLPNAAAGVVLKEKINEDFKLAYKEKREAELSVLKTLKAGMLNKEKEKIFQASKSGHDIAQEILGDEEIIDVISSEIKKLRDAIVLFEQGGRTDLVLKNQQEINILMRYLPAQLGEEEIKELVAKAVTESGAASIKDMGKVMGVLMPKVKGRADNALVSKLVKDSLQG